MLCRSTALCKLYFPTHTKQFQYHLNMLIHLCVNALKVVSSTWILVRYTHICCYYQNDSICSTNNNKKQKQNKLNYYKLHSGGHDCREARFIIGKISDSSASCIGINTEKLQALFSRRTDFNLQYIPPPIHFHGRSC